MKSIYIIIIVCLLGSCNSQTNTKTKNTESTDLTQKVDSTEKLTEKSTQTDYQLEKIDIPVIGTFELSEMKMDSLNEYGAGDCWGTIRRYSLPNFGLAIDSITCGEYGFTYTYYLLSDKDFIQVVYTKKSESILDPETNSFFYVQEEQVIDFNSDPATSMNKIDTLTDYKLREKPIDKEFSTEILKDKQTSYDHLEMNYQGTWEMEIDH
ncbi:hypothetical protein [Robertkochia solimangrovi]|uniref:hypothetical protein n=1 Tax=Robertkochia solimangrovi TaxID=2213046 RepID=UPI00117CD63F|nr:hypothetical protein [Robertkochia solimangrovi]TRZ43129.1 hypothetical protein DMZ48_10575 [Robertkochia solimangrovi]